MRLWSYGEIKTKVELDLDLQGQEFVTDAEMLGYCNDGIAKAEATIHNLNEDYFLDSDYVPLVAGVSAYDLPSNVFGMKIRQVVYDDGTSRYEVRRIRLQQISCVDPKDGYMHHIESSGTSGTKMVIFPASRVTSSTYMRRWFIRHSNRMVADGDVCDIPEFVSYVVNYMKVQCALKDGHPRLDAFQAELADSRELMVSTLIEMVPDENNDIPMDLSFYDEMV